MQPAYQYCWKILRYYITAYYDNVVSSKMEVLRGPKINYFEDNYCFQKSRHWNLSEAPWIHSIYSHGI
jgi:hypothetical protein